MGLTNHKGLDASNIILRLLPEDQQLPPPQLDDPSRRGRNLHTAHILTVNWTADGGWEAPEISPYGKLALEPTASVLHYATEAFEGLKVYRGWDGKLRLFRPWLNCQRMLRSNAYVGLPSFSVDELLTLLATFARIECPHWLPHPGSSLYLRPSMIGTGSALGMQKPAEALFFLFGALFPQSTGNQCANLLASSPDQVRAWPGGFGGWLTLISRELIGANYGPTMPAQTDARENGCTSTLWLFGEDGQVTESGGSNFFVIWRREDDENVLELVTCSVTDRLILNGITRRSILELARERLSHTSTGAAELPCLEVREGRFVIHDIFKAQKAGRLLEAFITGTSASVTPVAGIKWKAEEITIPVNLLGFTSMFHKWLDNIIYGVESHDWAYIVPEI
ncbi:branched-chain-amino-acid aminotransferase, cytosolic [Aspergillus udagawae]|uniref:Branched-chain-amino-acid aminotransferase, cytosolic n=1 Tax=Aspergillus udagawae TaxID=91492 RepID=A0ABQ1BFG8_9EURO|nr:branched-chain-amino-acid aminotransferase, cytosolic [Aspergillus udagawae]